MVGNADEVALADEGMEVARYGARVPADPPGDLADRQEFAGGGGGLNGEKDELRSSMHGAHCDIFSLESLAGNRAVGHG